MYKDTNALSKAIVYIITNAQREALLLDYAELIDILEQLRKVCRHDKYLAALIFCVKDHINKDLNLKTALTTREEEIILLIGKGDNNNNISKALNISRLTVESHRKNIRKKLKHHKNLDLSMFSLLYAMQHGEIHQIKSSY
ncbi:response regulator transcription factor [Paucihalobacter sp.]|uniref:response regulator transcription factor n=1 Tax=Paucihalobacter sp. TaxID=2850405 RepID=UPI003D160497